TNVGGIPDSIKDGYDGILIPSHDSNLFACAIEEVVQNSDLRQRLIKNGYSRARELTIESFTERILAVLEMQIESKNDA
ncbi:MAG TPA: glycosyltransferase, partial [Candidatus Dependentiae bacterium]|nr:glycosyltransferase [Candidatus Dependentiae bacterium]